jgi:hypothetical protein
MYKYVQIQMVNVAFFKNKTFIIIMYLEPMRTRSKHEICMKAAEKSPNYLPGFFLLISGVGF